jgi:putative membrane protein
MTVSDLPAVNACLNGLSAAILGMGFYFIRRQKRIAHRNCMIAAVCSSTLFLACYLAYHITVKTVTHFRDPSWFRPVYLAILLTHTVLATAILPLVAITLAYAARGRFDSHRKIARWTWPLWMYVSVSGVLIYLLLYRIFPQL